MDQFLPIIVTAVVTGSISTATTVIALRVHIQYLRETLGRHEKWMLSHGKSIETLREHHSQLSNRVSVIEK